MLLTFVCFFGYSVRRNETCRNSETRTLFVVLRQIEMGEWVAHESEPVPFANATLERSECNNKIWVSVICRHMPFAHDNPQLTRQWSWQTIKPFYRFARSCASVTIRFLVLVGECVLFMAPKLNDFCLVHVNRSFCLLTSTESTVWSCEWLMAGFQALCHRHTPFPIRYFSPGDLSSRPVSWSIWILTGFIRSISTMNPNEMCF